MDTCRRRFTWKYGTTMRTYRASRLDRFLGNDSWRCIFPEAGVQHVTASYSDHCPLSLSSHPSDVATGDRLFRFLAAWTFTVAESWAREHVSLSDSLSKLTSDLKVWNRRSFGNVFYRKRKLLARIAGVQRQLSVNPSGRLLSLDRYLGRKLDVVLDQEQLIWFQKSRANFLIEGDRNTIYYHLSTIVKRRAAKFLGLMDTEGNWVSNKLEVEKLVVDFFARLYTADPEIRSSLVVPTFSVTFPQLPTSEVDRLSAPFSGEDVWAALKSMSPYKSPGPDGYPALFYQQNWSVVGPRVTDAILKYVNQGVSLDGIENALMVLLPKVPSPMQPAEFRPISLLNVVFKIMTKMMVFRLKSVLSTLIHPAQASFIPRRQIIDNVVIVQEVLHSMADRSGSRKWMMLKIDLAKAYDRISWPFLREMLCRAQLPAHLIKVIMNCQTKGRTEILWNGGKAGSFDSTRGIRQGDTLSPYLFVLCMELLSHIIRDAVNSGAWRPITVGGVSLSHVFFADDLILFGEANAAQAEVIKECLNRFCKFPGKR
ncbi:hypothetical protein V2J09_016610 [Rumex salicifolius]